MQILITTSALKRPRIVQFTPWSLVLTLLALLLPMMVLSLALYHVVVLKAAHERWPVISEAVRYVERQDRAQRDRYVRENLDAMAEKVGDLQARLLRLEAVGERVAGMAGVKPEELKRMEAPAQGAPGGRGGPLVPLRETRPSAATIEDLSRSLDDLQIVSDRHADVFTLIESHLFEKRLEALMVPSSAPVNGPVGSGFGFRSDPFTGRPALHTGLDYPADVGTPIMAAAGGVVVSAGPHPQYGLLIEIEHGKGLLTRYAHTSKMLVKQGDIVKRGQQVAEVGNTGRSTGPHLHFEVLVEGVQQNPAKFLAQVAPARTAGMPVQ
ncbi:M23 family metallopeptidase [uncultured Aquabacterium sp.]|uniref:M23 family metallopeptidase n=1 Tax=uncultured Aquabacterium sp. TaxID=158753 RepID=UPI0025F62E4C|nr:M23 family metallopeptidase [uncultured Aquabacterium sp.]